MSLQVSCALCENTAVFCQVEDIWWLCARCTALEHEDLGRISQVKLKEVRVELKKLAMLPPEVKLKMCKPETADYSGYNKALAGYMRRVGTDLTTDISPPKSLYIEVSYQDFGVLDKP